MKQIYRRTIKIIEKIAPFIKIKKTYLFEKIAILKKKKMYKKIKWTKEQQIEFDKYWIENYGKKISNRWHKLYESVNGTYNKKYIPEIIYSTKIEPKWNDYLDCNTFENKALCDIIFFSSCEEKRYKLPDTFLIKERGIIYNKNREIISKEQAIKIIENLDEVVLKPTKDTSSGEGVCLLKEKNKIIENFFNNKLYKNSILQKKINQSKDLENLNKTSVNTFRVISYILNDRVNIAEISLRIGTNNSFVDNIHSGGLVIKCTKDGNLERYAYKLGWGDSNEKFEVHPITKIKFEDYKINGVEKIIEAAIVLHGKLPGIKIISWDFTLNENEVPVLIESNLSGQSIWFPQIVSGNGIFSENTEQILNEIREGKWKVNQ